MRMKGNFSIKTSVTNNRAAYQDIGELLLSITGRIYQLLSAGQLDQWVHACSQHWSSSDGGGGEEENKGEGDDDHGEGIIVELSQMDSHLCVFINEQHLT